MAQLTVLGRIRSASNATFLCEAHLEDRQVHCVYKPVAGEAPLWDFPDGTLAGREVSAYLVSAALGWNVVPYTVVRDGPAGRGMVQRWVDQPGDVLDDRRRRRASRPDTGPDLVDLLPQGRHPARLPADPAGLRLRRRRGDPRPRRRSASAPHGRVRRPDQQRRPQGWPHPVRSGRRGLRRRPRCELAHRRQAAHRAVGLGGQAGGRRRARAAWRLCATRFSATSTRSFGRTSRIGRSMRCTPEPLVCWRIR